MADRNTATLVFADLRGGRNGGDPPMSIPDDQVVEAVNVDYWQGTLANKRGGSTSVSLTFSSGGPFTQTIGSLIRHVPSATGAQEVNAELWAFDINATSVVGRLAGAATWVAPTMTDNCTDGRKVVGVSFNDKLVLCYDSTQNRLHAWDPTDSKVRRLGLATPAAATVANGGGAGVAVIRYYKVAYAVLSGSTIRYRSELSAAVSFTPGANSATVTKPASISEDETHWLLYGSADNSAYYLLATTVVGTTTYDDTATPANYTGTAPPLAGSNTPPPSARYVVADDARLVMAGGFETSGGYTTPKETRVWFTPVLGDADVGDDERIPNTTDRKNWIDVEEAITGLGGPMNGTVYVFGYRRMWALVPTGDVYTPYRRITVSRQIGCIRHQSIVMAEDEHGSPCLYWWSACGPHRIGPQGLQYCGNDIEDLVAGMVLSASTTVHGVYHADKHQIWWWLAATTATGTATDPRIKVVFDVRLGQSHASYGVVKGWTVDPNLEAVNVTSCSALCSTLYANTLGATVSRDLKPYIGNVVVNTILKCDTSDLTDGAFGIQAYIRLKPIMPYGMGIAFSIGQGWLLAEPDSGTTITQTLIDTFGLNADRTSTALLTAAGSETRVLKQFEGADGAGLLAAQLQIGDTARVGKQWTLDMLSVQVSREERR